MFMKAIEKSGDLGAYSCKVPISSYILENKRPVTIKAVMDNNKESYTIYTSTTENAKLLFTDPYTYLNELKNDDYVTFITAKDEATYGVDEKTSTLINELGINIDWGANFRKGFCIVKNRNDVQINTAPEKADISTLSGQINDEGLNYQLESSGYESVNNASIILNSKEYAVNRRGLNITVYSREYHKVISSVRIDTCETYEFNVSYLD